MLSLTTMVDVLVGADTSPALQVGSSGAAYTRAQLRLLCAQFASTLRAAGISPGDVVTIAEPNTVRRRQGCCRAGRLCPHAPPRRTLVRLLLPALLPWPTAVHLPGLPHRWSLLSPSSAPPWPVRWRHRSTKTTKR